MAFSLEVLAAKQGDCLLLRFPAGGRERLMIIDGGPDGVYAETLKPRLEALRPSRQAPAIVDTVLVSHIDDDHIQGILDLTRDLLESRSRTVPVVEVNDLLHNTFDDIIGTRPKELRDPDAESAAAALDGTVPFDNSMPADLAKVLAAVPQGRALRDDGRTLGWAPNPPAKGGLLLAAAGAKPFPLGDVAVTIVGPMKPEVQALQKLHDKWLVAKKKGKTGAASTLAAYLDTSVPNLSSIVLLLECGGKSILLTGDARGDKIIQGLELTGRLKDGGDAVVRPLHVDILKVPHHGSARNMECAFFERVTADHYVFSGDGTHGNPERETLEMLFAARPTEPFTLHFTYDLATIDAQRAREWEKERKKAVKRKAANPAAKVRKKWSAATHGLVALRKERGGVKKQKWLEGAGSDVISLLK